MKARIIFQNGDFVIQERHFLLKWIWVDAWMNYYPIVNDRFPTLEEAYRNLKWFGK